MKRKANKTVHIGARLAGGEFAALRLMAIQENRPYSEMLRELIREGAERRGLPPLAFVKARGVEDAINE